MGGGSGTAWRGVGGDVTRKTEWVEEVALHGEGRKTEWVGGGGAAWGVEGEMVYGGQSQYGTKGGKKYTLHGKERYLCGGALSVASFSFIFVFVILISLSSCFFIILFLSSILPFHTLSSPPLPLGEVVSMPGNESAGSGSNSKTAFGVHLTHLLFLIDKWLSGKNLGKMNCGKTDVGTALCHGEMSTDATRSCSLCHPLLPILLLLFLSPFFLYVWEDRILLVAMNGTVVIVLSTTGNE